MSFEEDLYALDGAGSHDRACDLIFDRFDDLFCAGQFAEAETILQGLDVDRLSRFARHSLLTITRPAKDRLPSRKRLRADEFRAFKNDYAL